MATFWQKKKSRNIECFFFCNCVTFLDFSNYKIEVFKNSNILFQVGVRNCNAYSCVPTVCDDGWLSRCVSVSVGCDCRGLSACGWRSAVSAHAVLADLRVVLEVTPTVLAPSVSPPSQPPLHVRGASRCLAPSLRLSSSRTTGLSMIFTWYLDEDQWEGMSAIEATTIDAIEAIDATTRRHPGHHRRHRRHRRHRLLPKSSFSPIFEVHLRVPSVEGVT